MDIFAAAIGFILFFWVCFLSADIKMLQKTVNSLKAEINSLKWGNHAAANDSGNKYAETAVNDSRDKCDKSAGCDEYASDDFDDDAKLKPASAPAPKSFCPQKNAARQKNGFEELFLGSIFNIAGAFSIIAACIVFFLLIAPALTPLMKTAAGFISGAAVIALSFILKKNTPARFFEVLIGTGFSVLFITLYCSLFVFKTFSVNTGLIIGAFLQAFAYFAAEKQKTVSMAAIALIGGYAGIVLCAGHAGINEIFASVLFLNIVSIIFAFRNPDKAAVNFINLIVSFLIMSAASILQGEKGSIIYPLLLWAVYIVYDLAGKEKSENFFNASNILNFLNLSVLAAFSRLIFSSEKQNTGILLLSACIVYAVITAVLTASNSEKKGRYVHSLLLCAFFSIFFLFSGIYTALIWSFAAVCITAAARFYKINYIAHWTFLYLSAAFIKLLFTDGIYFTANIQAYTPFFNTRLLGMGAYTAAVFICSLIYKNSDETKTDLKYYILQFGWITALAVYLIFELHDFITLKSASKAAQQAVLFADSAVLSLIGFNYSVTLKYLSKKSGIEVFAAFSYVVYWIAACVLCLFCFKYPSAESFIPLLNLRFPACIFAIGASIIQARFSNLDLFRYAAAVFGFFFITAEMLDIAAKYNAGAYLVSAAWIIYAGIITAAGIFKNKSFLKKTGIVITIAAILKVIFYDTANIEMLYRLIIFTVLGIILLCISYYYARKNKKR